MDGPSAITTVFSESSFLRPEYGGDGGKQVGVCANKIAPVASLPAHWAPNAMVRYDKQQFPARYRNGVFIAFHGSWDRAPYTQQGYNVVFQPLQGERASGTCEVFADGFAGPTRIRLAPRIVPPALPWARMGRSLSPTTSAAGSTGLCTRVVSLAAPRR